ncbi:MAG: pyrimidine dimer DNA glycosylase/endonuclease V [Candidatus Omnitrophica bacterium]|jgi:hypothetical protein|nr:pyrimidine dimer DNA glycosylase/endonuclease V [Candidatus Omnitrophota bacterium]
MRLWSIHPEYLDTKGLLAVWREALLAQKVLSGKTKGYKNHPQLIRFRQHAKPLEAIGFYLYNIYKEATLRGYNFQKDKIFKPNKRVKPIKVLRGQVVFELRHFAVKSKKRDKARFKEILKVKRIKLNPLFDQIPGGIELWEKVQK